MKPIQRVAMMTTLVAVLGLMVATPCQAGWLDQLLGGGKSSGSTSNAATAVTALTADEMS